jgi:lipopolysaccharide assembly protein A
MGQTALIVFLLLATGVAIFAVQNAGPVTVRFGFWSLEMSLVVVILVAAALGAVMTSLVSLPGWFRDRRLLRQQTRELETLRVLRPPMAPSPTPPAASAPQRPADPPPSLDPPARSG